MKKGFIKKWVILAVAFCAVGGTQSWARTSEVKPDAGEESDAAYRQQLCRDHCADLYDICMSAASDYWSSRVESAKSSYSGMTGDGSSPHSMAELKNLDALRSKLESLWNSLDTAEASCMDDYQECAATCDY